MKIDLLGHVQVDSNHILVVDIRKFVFDPSKYREFGLLINTYGIGHFPVYRVADNGEGGFGKSRIIIEIKPDAGGRLS